MTERFWSEGQLGEFYAIRLRQGDNDHDRQPKVAVLVSCEVLVDSVENTVLRLRQDASGSFLDTQVPQRIFQQVFRPELEENAATAVLSIECIPLSVQSLPDKLNEVKLVTALVGPAAVWNV